MMILPASEAYKTKSATIRIDEEGVLCVYVHENAEMDQEEMENCFNIYRQLGCADHKILELIDGSNDFNITKEGREYASKHAKEFFIASALVTTNLAVRLVFNFFTKFYDPEVPFKLFKTEAEARAWLYEFRTPKSPKKLRKEGFLF